MNLPVPPFGFSFQDLDHYPDEHEGVGGFRSFTLAPAGERVVAVYSGRASVPAHGDWWPELSDFEDDDPDALAETIIDAATKGFPPMPADAAGELRADLVHWICDVRGALAREEH